MKHGTHTKWIFGATVIAALVATTGCNKSSGSGGSGAGPAGSGASGGGGGKGLAAADNDPKLVALAKKALTCPWKADEGDFDHSCADWKAWHDASEAAKSDATIISMLEDDDEKVRELAAFNIDFLDNYATDKALASRLVAVAEKENSKISDLKRIGFAVGDIHVKETGLFERVKGIVKSGNPQIRMGIVDTLVMRNQSDPAVFDFVKELTKDSNQELASAAVYAFKYVDKRAADACKVFVDSLAGSSVVAHAAAVNLSSEGHNGGITCDSQLDTLLGDIEKRAKAGTIDDTAWVGSLENVTKNSKASPAQKTHAVAIAKLIVENAKNQNYARSSALSLVGDGDAKNGKTYAKKFLHDKDTYVSGKAKTISEKK